MQLFRARVGEKGGSFPNQEDSEASTLRRKGGGSKPK